MLDTPRIPLSLRTAIALGKELIHRPDMYSDETDAAIRNMTVREAFSGLCDNPALEEALRFLIGNERETLSQLSLSALRLCYQLKGSGVVVTCPSVDKFHVSTEPEWRVSPSVDRHIGRYVEPNCIEDKILLIAAVARSVFAPRITANLTIENRLCNVKARSTIYNEYNLEYVVKFEITHNGQRQPNLEKWANGIANWHGEFS